eukprot:354835-Rhodomonas_salina.4
MQVWRPAPAEGDFPEHSYSLIGETLLEPEAPGLTKIQVSGLCVCLYTAVTVHVFRRRISPNRIAFGPVLNRS